MAGMERLFDAVMFDLDGTLLDTLADIAAAGNHVLSHFGRLPIPVERYRYLAGQGAPYLVEHALGDGLQPRVGEGLDLFKAYQLKHGLDQTEPYPGIPELLDELAKRNLRMAVLSNKPHAATQVAVRSKLSRWAFDAVVGHRPEVAPLKPDPTAAVEICIEMSIPPERWLYVGDTAVDMQTAAYAGMFGIGVLWGFREEAELREAGAKAIVREPMEVLRYLAD